MVNDTTCVYDVDYELTISGFSSNCIDDGGEFDDNNNCIFNFTEEFDYIYDMETGEYCETYNEGSYSNCFEGDDSYGPCSTCGYYEEEEDAQGAYDCITCPEDYEIDVYFDDCTGYCVPTGTAQNPISTSDCQPHESITNSWIGFTDEATEGDWVWTTGEDVVYTNWAAGEPNDSNDGEDCAEMWGQGAWNDLTCDWERPFIMEVDNYIDLEYSNFSIELNGEENAELAAGNPLVVTVTFDSAAAEPNAGLGHIVYDINMNGELNDDDFIVEGNIIIVDNDEFDENPAVGIVVNTFDPNDPDVDLGILFWLTMQTVSYTHLRAHETREDRGLRGGGG